MKINSLQISNILSFQYYENIDDAPELSFDDGLNILIGENGAGKSTALEIINFIFKRVIFLPYNFNQSQYTNYDGLPLPDRQRILVKSRDNKNYSDFRLDPNHSSEDNPQVIKLVIELDDVDRDNIAYLKENYKNIEPLLKYTRFKELEFSGNTRHITLVITLKSGEKEFVCDYNGFDADGNVIEKDKDNSPKADFEYLENYFFYNELINIYNLENPDKTLSNLYETFILVGGYRNYNTFSASVQIGNDPNKDQIREIRNLEMARSINALEQNEPSIFRLIRLQLAEKYLALYQDDIKPSDAEKIINEQHFLQLINEKLALVNLSVSIKCVNNRSWAFSFTFYDLIKKRNLGDINSLSAGQKAIIHLIFETYGHGEMKGGVVIIDEPEIHLHYQFQHAYLQVIEQINQTSQSQYILVTHSESLINSETIHNIKRFSLNAEKCTEIKYPPQPTEKEKIIEQNTLIKILDNTKSTYALFAKKVVLVEGDTDRYFFKTALNILKPDVSDDIAILYIGGNASHINWRNFFEGFGLDVYFITDWDSISKLPKEYSVINTTDFNTIRDGVIQHQLNNLSEEKTAEFQQVYDNFDPQKPLLHQQEINILNALRSKLKSVTKIDNTTLISAVKTKYPDLDNKIENLYKSNIFILKHGNLENYTETSKKLPKVIEFCENSMADWLQQDGEHAQEIRMILDHIVPPEE